MLRRIRTIDRLLDGRMSRREFNDALTLFGLTAVTVPMVSRPLSAAERLLLFTWGGLEDPSLFPDYAAKHGKIDATFYGDEYEAIEKLRAGYEADIVGPCIDVMPRWMTTGLQPIDESRLLHLDEQFASIRNAEPSFYDGERYYVSMYWGFSSFVYRTDLTDIEPEDESWTLLFDEKYKGRMAIWDSTDAVVPHASLALGYSDDPYRPDGERLERVAEMVRKQRDLVRFYFSSVTEAVQAIASGEVVISYAWSDFLSHLKTADVPFKWANPKEGLISYNCGLARANRKGNEEAQYDFINASMTADVGKFLIEVFNLGASNKTSFDMVDPALLKELELSTPEESLTRSHPFVYVPPELKQKHIEMFDDIKAGA